MRFDENSMRSWELPELNLDADAADKKDLRQLEGSLQKLWEKARLVSDSLLRLRSENQELKSRIASLESQEHHWTEELQRRERDLKQIRSQLAQAQSNGSNLFSKEEAEELKSRLKELITKINSRLWSKLTAIAVCETSQKYYTICKNNER